MKVPLLFLVFLLNVYTTWSQVPADKSQLNYTNVYFEDELKPGATEYVLFIYADSVSAKTGRALQKIKNSLPAFWVTLSWNHRYYWKITAYNKSRRQIQASDLRRFDIISQAFGNVDTIIVDVKTNQKTKHAGGLICIDYTRSIYNRQGMAVWTIPLIPGIINGQTQVRDLKVTHHNTITFLTDKFPVEIDLNGAVLWRAPYPFLLGKDTILYHHDFKKTSRGTYMVLGNKKISRKLSADYLKQSGLEAETEIVNGIGYKKTLMTVLLEFNARGELLWYWDADDYITDEDLHARKSPSGFPEFSTHSNAFSETPAGDKLFVGFRDLNRIVRIDKKTKKVDRCYGHNTTPTETPIAPGLFKRQHDATITQRNSILVFNNNSTGAEGDTAVSSVVEFGADKGAIEKAILWQFNLNFDKVTNGKSMAGGNVVELPNGNLLVCAGTLNRVFEVTRNKEIVWDAFILDKQKNETAFKPLPQYRCNWTHQLNQYHFIAWVDPKPVTAKTTAIKLANTGNATDTFQLEVVSFDGILLEQLTARTVPAGKTLTFDIQRFPHDPGAAPGLMVRSMGNGVVKFLQLE